jgi:hypothetical protein
MSNLLEQAIIDANALKEVALRNAQANLIEKYSKEFKETVEKLLEQEEVAPAAGIGTDPAAAPLPDVSAPVAAPIGSEEPIKNVPSSFLDGDEDELITINFDEIKKQLTANLGSPIENPLAEPEAMPAPEETPEVQPMMEEIELDEMYDGGLKQDVADDALAEDHDEEFVIHIDGESDDEDTEEEFEFELEEMEDPTVAAAKKTVADASAKEATVTGDLKLKTGQARSALANAEKAVAARAAAQPSSEPAEMSDTTGDLDEDFAITEEELTELAEELRVDLKPENGSRGYMGTTETEKKLQRNVELAAARDAEETKKRAEDKKRVADLQMENKALKLTIDEFKGILVSLKEAQEIQSVSNAKLLYTNKTLVNTSLNERQKQAVVESINKARSVQEAKTIYETLQSTVEGNSSSSKNPKSLSEALNRGPSPFMARKPQVSADDSFADRMKLLAGIKNN